MSEPNYDFHNSIGVLVGTSSRLIRRALNRRFEKERSEITGEQWLMLLYIWANDEPTQQQLADIMIKSKVAVAKQVAILERLGLVTRRSREDDRREKHVCLTPEGKSLQARLTGIADENLQAATQGIPDAELETCKRVLRRIIGNIA